MNKHTTIGELPCGAWFHFPKERTRWLKTQKRFFLGHTMEVESWLCASLQTGLLYRHAVEVLVVKVKKKR